MKAITFVLSIFLLLVSGMAVGSDNVYNMVKPDKENARARELVSKMTLEEKCDYIGAVTSFVMRSVDRLGIPQIRMADGPQGIRNNTVSTLYPSGILTAATWNRDLAEKLGHGLGKDAKARGVAILLGPGVNIYRAPMNGRNFEYFGEDPYLSGVLGVAMTRGYQSVDMSQEHIVPKDHIMACLKHFALYGAVESGKDYNTTDMSKVRMYNQYLPP